MTETTQTNQKPQGLLDGIEVLKPEASYEKTKKYICGIRKTKEMGGFELQLRVGAACFSTSTFEWRGKGPDAQMVFRDGALQVLSQEQIDDIKAKLKHRYIRVCKDDKGQVTGVQDVDATDGGDTTKTRQGQPMVNKSTGELVLGPDGKAVYGQDDGQPRRLAGRLHGGETPLKDILILESVYDNPRLNGRTVTVSDIKAMLAEAEAEEARELEGGDAVFESGKGGKRQKGGEAEKARDPKALQSLSTTDGKKKAEAGYLGQ